MKKILTNAKIIMSFIRHLSVRPFDHFYIYLCMQECQPIIVSENCKQAHFHTYYGKVMPTTYIHTYIRI